MIHPDTELKFINNQIGYGVIATKFIPKGTITWAYDLLDRTFSPEYINGRDKVYQDILNKYGYRDNEGNIVLCWDNARFVNHSFHSTCMTTAYNFELAIRDIYPGEELTDDYGYLNCIETFECLPEPNTTRTHVHPDDLLYFYKEWDCELLSAFRHFKKIEQPLVFLLQPQFISRANGIAEGNVKMDSILNNFFSEDAIFMEKKRLLLEKGDTYKLNELLAACNKTFDKTVLAP